MAYRSKISKNKYYGSTFAGRVATSNETPFTELANAIRRNTGEFERYADNYTEGKKDAADKYLEGYYATGGTPEKLSAEILAGKHPELDNMYAETAIATHNGRFMATKAIAEIDRLKDTYTPFEEGKEQTWNEWVSSLRYDDGSPVMPSLDGKSKGFNTGFASMFTEYRANSLIADADMRSKHWQNKKFEAGMNFMHTNLMVMDKTSDQYWQVLQTLNTELPTTSGLTGKSYYYTASELNDLAIGHASWVVSNATTEQELDRAMSILTADRGVGKDNNPLGSLMNTKRTDVAALIETINNKKVSMTNQKRADDSYAEKEEVKNIFVDLMENDILNLQNRDDAKNKLKKFGDPKLLDYVDQFYNKNRFTNNDPKAIDTLHSQVLNGNFEEPADVMKYILDNGIPTDQLSTALSYWSMWNTNNEKGIKPIHQTNTTYSDGMNSALTSIKGVFTDPETSLRIDGQETAMMNAENYMIRAIAEYEMNYAKDNNGKKPPEAERQNFIFNLGKNLTAIYQIDSQAYPKRIEGVDYSIIEKEEVEKLELKKKKQKELNEAITNFEENVKLFTTNIGVGSVTLPEFSDADKSWRKFESTEKAEFKKNKLYPALRETLGDTFNIEGIAQIIDGLDQTVYSDIVNNIANALNLDVADVQNIIGEFIIADTER
ncbi:hypothetical protein P109_gp39 [Pelagibacter phage HTVC109P]|nr:hypothetical protein P109_gp39 [Pelagibacter phage HTVC109P]